MGYEVDPGALRSISNTLRSGSRSLEDAGESMPGFPDAGQFSGVIGGLVSVFTDAAGELSNGVAAAADAVDDGGRVYDTNEDAARQNFEAHGDG